MVKCFVINLADRKDRMENAYYQLFKIGVKKEDIYRVDAVDTRRITYDQVIQRFPDIDPKDLESLRVGRRAIGHHELTSGAIGCYYSHVKAMRQIVDTVQSGSEVAVIVEDDILAGATSASEVKLKRLFSGNKLELRLRDTDVYFLGHLGDGCYNLGLHCYAMRASTAATLTSIIPPPRMQLDWELQLLKLAQKIRLKHAKICHVTVLNKDSDIQDDQACDLGWDMSILDK